MSREECLLPLPTYSRPSPTVLRPNLLNGNLGLSCGVVLETESRQTHIHSIHEQNLDLIIIIYYAEPRGAHVKTVWLISCSPLLVFYLILDEGPGVAREKKYF